MPEDWWANFQQYVRTLHELRLVDNDRSSSPVLLVEELRFKTCRLLDEDAAKALLEQEGSIGGRKGDTTFVGVDFKRCPDG